MLEFKLRIKMEKKMEIVLFPFLFLELLFLKKLIFHVNIMTWGTVLACFTEMQSFHS